jgi:hypothetical protein
MFDNNYFVPRRAGKWEIASDSSFSAPLAVSEVKKGGGGESNFPHELEAEPS